MKTVTKFAFLGAFSMALLLAGGAFSSSRAQMENPHQAGPMFPAGTMVSEVEVPGGIDLVFWGSDLAGIVSALKSQQAQCGDEKSTGGSTCSVTSNGSCADFAIRGQNCEKCCTGMITPGKAAGKKGCLRHR